MFKKILAIIISTAMIFSLSINAFAIDTEKNAESGIYIENFYSVVKSDQWKSLNRLERANACQVNKETLANMCTNDLIQVVVSYPFFIDILMFDNVEIGYNSVLSECNALQELVTREDRCPCLLNAYKDIKSKTESSDYTSDNKRNLMYIELLLQQKDFSVENHNILNTLLSSTHTESSAGLRSSATVVYTPNGSAVSVERWNNADDDFTYEERTYWHQYIAAYYPNAVRLGNATRKYNCHSYAWYSQSTANIMWMNNPSKYMTDGSYSLVSKTNAVVGDRMVYYTSTNSSYTGINHSAIILSKNSQGTNITLKSKWGQLGLYQHAWNDCPYYYNNGVCDVRFYHR